MRTYEELFILKTGLPEEEVTALIDQISGVITTSGGTILKTDNWGTRKLAYRVRKQAEGVYVLIQFTSGPAVVKEVERRLRVQDNVLKFITVRIDEKMKKVEKRKKQREKRAARKPVIAAPAAPLAMPLPASPSPGIVPGAPVPAMPASSEPVPATEPVPVTEHASVEPVQAALALEPAAPAATTEPATEGGEK